MINVSKCMHAKLIQSNVKANIFLSLDKLYMLGEADMQINEVTQPYLHACVLLVC